MFSQLISAEKAVLREKETGGNDNLASGNDAMAAH